MDEKEIIIVTRDINGKRLEYHFDNQNQLASSHVEIYDHEEEILLILWGGICIYNSIGTLHSATWEDVSGYFA